jgi:dTDP-4-amino-4,6-dideoxygalactose transaminase
VRARQFAGLGYAHLGADGGARSVPRVHPDYQRFSSPGLNYRLSEAQAEIGLEKLKTANDAVILRQEIGALWQQTVGTTLQPHHDYSADNAFYSAAWPYHGDWEKLHARFRDAGGDGFYAAPQCPYNEPALREFKTQCPTAENLQRSLVLLKTHFSLDEAKRQAQILKSVL